MGAVQAGSELGTDASRQFGGAETFDGVLGHFALPLRRDGGRVHKRYPVDYLGARARRSPSEAAARFATFSGWLGATWPHLLDLLPEEPGDGGSRVEGDLHMIGSV